MAPVGRLRVDITDGNIFLFKYYFEFRAGADRRAGIRSV
jgi:hypothetical protein